MTQFGRIRFQLSLSIFLSLFSFYSQALIDPKIPHYGIEVVNHYPHRQDSFTQGLLFNDGYIYESRGLRGASALLKTELESGRVVESQSLAKAYFAEGLALVENQLVQLTYSAGVAFVYDLATLQPVKQLTYKGRGWGLTYDGKHLIMSDGSARLLFVDPNTFKPVKTVKITNQDKPLEWINELEYIDGYVFANVWKTNTIVVINPASGKVISTIDLSKLLDYFPVSPGDLNGIAFDKSKQRLFVTGKNWPLLFEIKLVAQ